MKWNGVRSRRVSFVAGEGVFTGVRVRRVVGLADYRWALPCISIVLRCHSNATRAPIANPPNSAQLGGIPYHSGKLHPGPCNSVGMRLGTDRQTHRRT